jgi:hypothetical protein
MVVIGHLPTRVIQMNAVIDLYYYNELKNKTPIYKCLRMQRKTTRLG